jgi:flagellar motor switch/type III secretory pathway protein FliN
MADTHPLSTQTGAIQGNQPEAHRGEDAGEQALIPSLPDVEEDGLIQLTPQLGRLPVEVDVAIPAKEFRVRNLLALVPGQVIETEWAHGEDLPLSAGTVQLTWAEFEVVDTQLAVRVTRLA